MSLMCHICAFFHSSINDLHLYQYLIYCKPFKSRKANKSTSYRKHKINTIIYSFNSCKRFLPKTNPLQMVLQRCGSIYWNHNLHRKPRVHLLLGLFYCFSVLVISKSKGFSRDRGSRCQVCKKFQFKPMQDPKLVIVFKVIHKFLFPR